MWYKMVTWFILNLMYDFRSRRYGDSMTIQQALHLSLYLGLIIPAINFPMASPDYQSQIVHCWKKTDLRDAVKDDIVVRDNTIEILTYLTQVSSPFKWIDADQNDFIDFLYKQLNTDEQTKKRDAPLMLPLPQDAPLQAQRERKQRISDFILSLYGELQVKRSLEKHDQYLKKQMAAEQLTQFKTYKKGRFILYVRQPVEPSEKTISADSN